VKDAEDAASQLKQERNAEWWDSTFMSRQEPDAAVIVIQTRWHERDLSGFILQKEWGLRPERWHIVDFPALMEKSPLDTGYYPPTCTIEPDWREYGDALCPDRFDKDWLEGEKITRGSYHFSALYQQRPQAREGNIFKRKWFDTTDKVPERGPTVRFWDIASSEDKGDYTVGVKMRLCGNKYYVMNVVRGQWSAGRRNNKIKDVARMDGDGVKVLVEQEPGASGKDAAQSIVEHMEGFNIRAIPVGTGSKAVRADPFVTACENDRVRLSKADWNDAYLDELCAFDKGFYDDQVDASVGAYKALRKRRVPVISPQSITGTNVWSVP